MKKNVVIAFWLFTILFLLLIGNLLKFTIFDGETIAASPYNSRANKLNDKIKRGTIYDRSGEPLAESTENGDIYERQYNYPYEFAHITGYIGNGTSAAEAKYNSVLQRTDDELLQRIYELFGADEPKCSDIYLTADKDLQIMAYNELQGKKGAVVLSEVKTGKILVLASNPSFDPNTVAEEWEKLDSDEDSPFLNRATQGLYPPGSTFKILTALAALEHYDDYENFYYQCKGTENFEDKTISCYNKNVHGKINISDAMKESCNTFFAKLGTVLGGGALRITADKALFNNKYGFQLPYSASSFSLEMNSPQSETVETSIGQGKTLATPLHINMITAAIANHGIMMKPYIVEYSKDYADKIKYIQTPEVLTELCSAENADKISEMLNYSVTQKTSSDYDIAGKTGTAENSSGADHSWFTAYAPANDPQYAVTIIFENNGKGSTAIPSAQKILSAALG